MDEKTPKKLIKTLKDLEKVVILAKKHNIDSITIEGIQISIPKVIPPMTRADAKVDTRSAAERDEDLLFNDSFGD